MRIPETPPDTDQVWLDDDLPGAVIRLMARTPPVDPEGRYLHWDEVRNRRPPTA